MKKTLALCTPIPEKMMEFIQNVCDVTICGELKHGKGNVTEEMTREECKNHELVVLGSNEPCSGCGNDSGLGKFRNEIYRCCKGNACNCRLCDNR